MEATDSNLSQLSPFSAFSTLSQRRLRAGVSASFALVFLLAFSLPAQALPIVEWDLANATGQTAAALVLDANLSASAIAPSASLTAWSSTAQDGFIAASGWAPAAPDPLRFYEFSITAGAGYTVDYRSLTLALFRGIQGTNHGAESWDVRASTDSFVSSDVFLQTLDISGSAADSQVTFSGIDITAIGTVGGTVSFRLYGYDYTATGDFSRLGNDSGWLIGGTGVNPMVDGIVLSPIPEPGTGLLTAVGLVLLGLRQSGRRS